MKNLKIREIVAAIGVVAAITALSPIAASAEWRNSSGRWWNSEGDSYSIGWRNINNEWYYFEKDGYMNIGWVNDEGTWYYMLPSGAMKIGWIKDGSQWYYMGPSGAMKTGWVYYGGKWYYMLPSGVMKTGWIDYNGAKYFASSSGEMQTGVIKINDKIYYFAPNGIMQKGKVTINGIAYNFATTGEAIGDKIPTPILAFTSDGVPVPITNPVTPPNPTNPDGDNTSGNHNDKGGGVSYRQINQQIFENQYKAATVISTAVTVTKNSDGTTTIKPTLNFTPGTYSEYVYGTGKMYNVTKDVYITLNGKDAYLTGDYKNGYIVDKNASGVIEISANICIMDSVTNKLYYVSSLNPQKVTI